MQNGVYQSEVYLGRCWWGEWDFPYMKCVWVLLNLPQGSNFSLPHVDIPQSTSSDSEHHRAFSDTISSLGHACHQFTTTESYILLGNAELCRNCKSGSVNMWYWKARRIKWMLKSTQYIIFCSGTGKLSSAI